MRDWPTWGIVRAIIYTPFGSVGTGMAFKDITMVEPMNVDGNPYSSRLVMMFFIHPEGMWVLFGSFLKGSPTK